MTAITQARQLSTVPEARQMSTAIPLVTVGRGARTVSLLRGTGTAGIASAAVITIATVIAVIGRLVAVQPGAASWRSPLFIDRRACSGSTSRAGTCSPALADSPPARTLAWSGAR
jgi:hypothetical protein